MGSNQVDAALAASRSDVGRKILALSEDQWFERKGSSIAPKDLAVTLVALANAEGGVVVVGVSNGKVSGFGNNIRKLNEIRQTSVNMTNPPVRARLEELPCINDHGVIDTIVVIRVETSERVHELTNGECYLRVGDSSHKLGFIQRQELEFDKGQAQYDGFTVAGASMADLDPKLVENYRQRSGIKQPVEVLFGARSLFDRAGKLTNAAYLLFGRHPQDLFPQAYIRVLRFLTNERGTGARLGLDDNADRRIEGAIPWAIQKAHKQIEEWMPKRRTLINGKFEPTSIIPTDAWLEGLVNAVIHRSYSLGGDHIRVEIYPNRIEIESPGRFPGLANPARPLEISRFARNPRIARVCADLRIGQELGEGIKRIFEEMQLMGLSDPIYQQTAGTVRLTLTAIPRLDPEIAQRLPRGSQSVLNSLRAAGGSLGTGDLASSLGLSRPATLIRLRALADEGLIKRTGKSPKDPRAIWELRTD
ncbi:MAG TPA: ATP-binding protein [Jatrophihabitans sp.]|jgi:ATP-dependent DNA helicase RecG|uniref:ATP-binding protein n=1 Tax=Jatrophihabitans sp. TaxID=1932789 RepID=UPI002F102B40